MIINHNLSAMNARRRNNLADVSAGKSMGKLSSGLRINQASDDAAGLAISEKMRSQIQGLNQASRNALDGISFIQTTEGYLTETSAVLQRLRVLSVQAANGINTAEDRQQIQVEVSQLVDEVDRIASQAQFNNMSILDGTFAADPNVMENSMWIHIGANADQRERITIGAMTAVALGIRDAGTQNPMNLETQDSANNTIAVLDEALRAVNKQRADLGAYQNRFEKAIEGLDTASENLQAAESRIRDLDMARETVQFTRDQILSQSSIAMLAQANQRPQMVLQLLQ
ncbi:flagellin [Candidatus Haliotispira prima]|uniref:Flagellin n=1 Tax=Candidatus Haliotispira prima TaxID=3034016 RepID=A0ABY8MJ51_9SPIO|nr:flagellin [Candidatus Haliotispira prima]